MTWVIYFSSYLILFNEGVRVDDNLLVQEDKINYVIKYPFAFVGRRLLSVVVGAIQHVKVYM